MAYPPPPYNSRSPHESERSRSSWDAMQRPHYPPMTSPSHQSIPSPGLFDPESDSSEVSDNPGEDYQTRIHSAYPIKIPPPPPKHALESPDAIDNRLRELQRVEDHNIKRQDNLRAKRARMDHRIRRKRDAQDAKIKAIMDARARRDLRISRRRKAEDDAFERFDQDLEEEETNLRRRLKRLKRGLPVEDLGMGSRISSASMSPPGPMYSNVPPPAKRHQTGPPGHNSPMTTISRPISDTSAPAARYEATQPPPYAFLQTSHQPTSAPHVHSPPINQSPSATQGAFQPVARSHSGPEPSPYVSNGRPPSPHLSRSQAAPVPSVLNTAPPPRQMSGYDTRPPPPPSVSSGFATINTPPSSGFAAINPRNAATPPAPPSLPLAKSTGDEHSHVHSRPYVSEGTPTGSSATVSGKRTPSTTHPYQMSEAFANRHHHCERVDHLNRGIWTSYGPGGTKDVPTGPPEEMYLRCNHDGCRRIDWRTVHGLQCHIVKSHEQPKGTIGSLEKALDRYGVPIAEVEAYEREHGDGSGGTMADPKNLKLKTKPQGMVEKSEGPRKPLTTQPNPTAYKTNLAMSLGNSSQPQPFKGSPVTPRSLPHEDTEGSEPDSRNAPLNLAAQPAQPPSRFAAVNGAWSTVPAAKPAEIRDHEMKDAPVSPHLSNTGNLPPKRDAAFWKMWPDTESVRPNSANNASPTYPGPVRSQGPAIPVAGYNTQPSPTFNNRPAFTPAASPHVGQTPVAPPPQTPLVPKQEGSPKLPNATSRISPPPTSTASTTETVAAVIPKTKEVSMTSPHASKAMPLKPVNATPATPPQQLPTPVPASAATQVPVQEKDTPATRETQKESEKPRGETVELGRVEPKSPENLTRRTSVVSVRRGSSRRSSVTASKAEKEREREREEAAAKAHAEAEAQSNAQKDMVPQPEQERRTQAANEEDRDAEKDEEPDKDDISDDPDTITAAVPSTSKNREKDKDREARENKTTPKRLANGRFVRKNR